MIIKDFRNDECEISEEEVINILKGIYTGTASNGLYMGGSLCYTHKVDNHPKGKEDFLFTFVPDDDISKEIDYWVSKLYLQNRNENAHYWDYAKYIVQHYEKEKV
jgi:hypothetical protein